MELLKRTGDAPKMDIFKRKEHGLNFGGNGKK